MKQNIIENSFLYRPPEVLRVALQIDREEIGELLSRAVQRAAVQYTRISVCG